MASRSAQAALVAVLIPLTAAAAVACTGAIQAMGAETPGASLAAAGDSGAGYSPASGTRSTTRDPASVSEVRELQRRLAELGMYDGPNTGNAGPLTQAAVRRFQASVGLPTIGTAGPRTWAKLRATSSERAKASASPSPSASAPKSSEVSKTSAIDARCLAPGKVICVDKTKRTLRKMRDGVVLGQADARFGPQASATREGTHAVTSKSRDHVSSIYKTKMLYALFFSGGQAVHFSADFAARGYAGASKGCINLRSRAFAAALYDWAEVGTKVIVYRS